MAVAPTPTGPPEQQGDTRALVAGICWSIHLTGDVKAGHVA